MRKSKISSPVGFMPKPVAVAAKQPKSGIIYSGPSLLDGKPIVVVALLTDSNDKTGAQTLQTYIIRSDIAPSLASKTGEDYSVCGNCKHRGQAHNDSEGPNQALNRTCYVLLFQAPRTVYATFKRGGYPVIDAASIGAGRFVRLGSYGDPAAVDSSVWDALLSGASGHTGYTHQMQTKGASVDYGTMMVSADSKQQAQGYHLNGKRTFRVIPVQEWEAKGNAALLKTETLCPASKEAGAKVQCNTCQLCSGTPTIEGYTKVMEQKIKEKQDNLESALSGVVDTATIEQLKAKIQQKEKAKPIARLRKIKSIVIVAHGAAKGKV